MAAILVVDDEEDIRELVGMKVLRCIRQQTDRRH